MPTFSSKIRPNSVAITLLSAGLLFSSCAVESQDPETSDQSSEVALPPPTNLAATAYSSIGVRLTWDATPGAAYYILYRGTASNAETTWTSISGTSYASNTHLSNSQYCYKIRSVNASIELSTFSTETCVTTPATEVITAPANVIAIPLSSSRISLEWDAVPTATSYRVFQGLTGGTLSYVTTTTTTRLYIAAGLLPATSYSFYVQAVTPTGSSPPSATVSATTLVDGLEGYWRFEEGAGTTVADQSGLARTGTITAGAFNKTNLPPVFRRSNVAAIDLTSGTTSAVNVAYTNGLRLAGAIFTASAWVNPAGDTTFIGSRASGCTSSIGWVLGANAASGLYFQDATTTRASNVAVPTGVWSNVAVVVDAGTITFYLNGVSVATQPYVSVARPLSPFSIGHVGGCPGAAALLDEVQVYSKPLTAAQIAATTVRPPAPTNVAVVNGCSKQQTISWNAVPGVLFYYLFRGTAAGNETYLTSVAPNKTSFVSTTLSPSTQYSWYVLSDINNVYSVPSNEVLLTTVAGPAAPASLTATAVSNSLININFPAVTGATRYFVYVSTAGGPLTYRTTVLAAGTVQIAGLAANTNYTFAVRALDGCTVQSVDSPTASATTQP
jgi:fibronectin type 3 domain-containing protein